MDNIPNLSGFADPQNVSQKGTGRFTADYINWARTLHDIRQNAPGWMPEMQSNEDGELVHKAPDGSCYLVIRFTHIDGTMTAGIPHAIMDHKMMPLAGDKVGARDVADSFVRGACKASAALFGYAWQMWSKDDPMERDNQNEAPIMEAPIMNQPTQHVTERFDEVTWPGKKKYHGETLGQIAKKDLGYLKGVLKQSYEVLQESDPSLLKAVQKVVSKYTEDGKQDFKKAA